MKTIVIHTVSLCVATAVLTSSLAPAEDSVPVDNAHKFRTLELPASLYPQLDSDRTFFVVWEARDLMELPLKYKGEIMAGTEQTYRKATLERWIEQNKTDFTKHMLIVAIRGYENISEKITLAGLKVTEREVRGDITTSVDGTPPSRANVISIVQCPRHARVGLYTGGPNPSITRENGLMSKEPGTSKGK
jgi:hypothetical protein